MLPKSQSVCMKFMDTQTMHSLTSSLPDKLCNYKIAVWTDRLVVGVLGQTDNSI